MLKRMMPVALATLLFIVLLTGVEQLGILAWSVLGLAVVTTGLNYQRVGLFWPHLMLPILFLSGAAGAYATIPQPQARMTFGLLAVIGFYYLERRLGQESHVLQSAFIASVFLIYWTIFALTFYFAAASLWWGALALGLTSGLLILQGFAGIMVPAKKYFLILTVLILTEAALGLLLWPTHFLVKALVLFMIFYWLWTFATAAFFGKLTRPKIYWQLTLGGIVLLATLGSAAWLPLK